LHEHLAQRGTTPQTWYALKLIAASGQGVSRQALSSDLERSRNQDAGSVRALLVRLEAEGLITGDAHVNLTPQGEERYRDLLEYVSAPTIRLLGQFDLSDVETTIRTMAAITKRAAEEAATAA
jgi:Mn-dependent DtxR family transcriptional regulator